MDFRKHWDRWLWMVPAAFILLAAARLSFGREPFCAAGDDEHCLREWVSALGGWAAVAAAVPTVLFLSKQVSDAERFARITIRMGTVPSIEHAKHIRRLAEHLKKVVENSIHKLQQMPSADGSKDRFTITVCVSAAISFLDRAELHDASREFQTLLGAKLLVDMLDDENTRVRSLPKTPSNEETVEARDSILGILAKVGEFSNELSTKVDQRVSMFEEVLKQA